MTELGCGCKCLTCFWVSVSKVSAVFVLPTPFVSDEGSAHHAKRNKQERAHGARRVCCAPAGPWHTTCASNDERNLLMKKKATRPSNHSVSARSSSKNLQVANSSVQFGHMAACVWRRGEGRGEGGQVSGKWCVYVMRECCFTAVIRFPHPCPSSTEVRTEPCYSQDGREQALRARRITTCFRSSWSHFSRPPDHFRSANILTECRCVCVQGTMKIVKCASAKIHVQDQETYATAMCPGELSDVAQTARLTEKHQLSTAVKEQETI